MNHSYNFFLLTSLVLSVSAAALDFDGVRRDTADILCTHEHVYEEARTAISLGGLSVETNGMAREVRVNRFGGGMVIRMFPSVTDANVMESVEIARTNGCHSRFRFYPDGELRRYEEYATNSLSGFSMTFYANRVVESYLRFTNGCFVGDAVWFAPDGSVRKIQKCTNEPVYEVRPPQPISQDPRSSCVHDKE